MKRILRGIVGRVIRWAVVEIDGADRGTMPWQQVRSLGQSGRSVAWYPYGFHAVAPAGSPGPMVQLSAQADALLHFPGSPKERPRLKAGEVGLYHPGTGSSILLLTDGSIEIDAKANLVVSVGGNLSAQVAGNLSADVTGSAALTAGTTATITAPTVTLAGVGVVTGNLDQDGPNIGFRGSAPVAKPVISGTKTGGTAQNELLIALDLMGIIDDQT